MFRGIIILAIFAGLVACKTSNSFTNSDRHQRYVAVYSTADQRTAMSSAAKDRKVGRAIYGLKAKLKKQPRDTRSWLNLAKLYVAQGKLSQAEGAAKKALRHDIKNTEAKKLLAQVALKQGKVGMAELLLSGLGGAYSKDSQVLNMLALVQMEKGNQSSAMALFKKALKQEPGNLSVRMNLGVSYLKYRQLHAAAIQFERVLKIMPDNADALLHLAIIKASQGDYDVAEEIYEDILSGKKNNPLALYNLAVLQSNNEDYGDALDNLKTYLKTAHAKSSDTDAVFGLIEKIKDQQAQSGKKVISDDEIQSLATNLDQNGQKQPEVKSQRDVEDYKNSVNEEARSGAADKDDELDALESELIE